MSGELRSMIGLLTIFRTAEGTSINTSNLKTTLTTLCVMLAVNPSRVKT